MTPDEQLRAQQHQNELRAFLRYERRLKQAYARSQDPFPRRWQPDGHCRGVQVNCGQSPSCAGENNSLNLLLVESARSRWQRSALILRN